MQAELDTELLLERMGGQVRNLAHLQLIDWGTERELQNPRTLLMALNGGDGEVCRRLKPVTYTLLLLSKNRSSTNLFQADSGESYLSYPLNLIWQMDADQVSSPFVFEELAPVNVLDIHSDAIQVFRNYADAPRKATHQLERCSTQAFSNGARGYFLDGKGQNRQLHLSHSYDTNVYLGFSAVVTPYRLQQSDMEYDPKKYTIRAPGWAEDYLLAASMLKLLSPVVAQKSGWQQQKQLAYQEALRQQPGGGAVTITEIDGNAPW